jgi:hypothetical protein
MIRSLTPLALCLGLLLAACGPSSESIPDPDPPPSAPTPEEQAAAIAQEVEEANGIEAWQNTRGVRFVFAGFRLHHWDKFTGDHRIDGRNRDGETFVVIQNLNTREGVALRNGQPAEGEELAELLETGYSAWINDTYWLLFQFKLRDPGVNLTYDGEEMVGDQVYDKLHLTFENVGLTPGDAYWAYVHRDTRRIDRWAFHLESFEEDQEPSVWDWTDYADYNGVQLSSTRTLLGSDPERQLTLTNIELMEAMPEGIFTSTEALELP